MKELQGGKGRKQHMFFSLISLRSVKVSMASQHPLYTSECCALNGYSLATPCGDTGFFRSVVTKKRRESTHARNSPFKIPSKMRACADSRRFFVTTDLKNPVCQSSMHRQEWCKLAFFRILLFRINILEGGAL